ncbi:hypothetical protein ASD78_13655 [Lysobacter sp. Root667]|uniref:hypothetical protein n=1 Tax=Lysobacter sp. Root667 TaxID=1736581 RepID=UPI0006FD29D7|nr:hypothetical protein [Lysobacter sp. Root667]KRA74504.1 hypothetical protein ASD78_13655 [Lysobacter sp. Root667]
MKVLTAATAFLAVILSSTAGAKEDSKSDALKDQVAYLTSISVPAMKDLCASLYPSFPDGVDVMFQMWLPEHQEQISRGRQAQISGLEPGKSIEEWELSTVESVKQQFNSAPRDKQDKRCLGLITALGQ